MSWCSKVSSGGVGGMVYRPNLTMCPNVQVIHHMLQMVQASAGAGLLQSPEAQRILTEFLSSLRNPQLKRPPPVHEMLSFCTLTPHCAFFLPQLI